MLQTNMLNVMRECRNFFISSSERGDFEIVNDTMAVREAYITGQYIALSGSILNDGVYFVACVENGVISFSADPVYPVWEQPEGTHDAYKKGDRVTHSGVAWESTVDGNAYEPGTVVGAWIEWIVEPATTDETFSGTIYGLRVPQDFVAMCGEIQAFNESSAGKPSALVSESVQGVHSWSKGTRDDGTPISWQQVFSGKLTPFRRMFAEVSI